MKQLISYLKDIKITLRKQWRNTNLTLTLPIITLKSVKSLWTKGYKDFIF